MPAMLAVILAWTSTDEAVAWAVQRPPIMLRMSPGYSGSIQAVIDTVERLNSVQP